MQMKKSLVAVSDVSRAMEMVPSRWRRPVSRVITHGPFRALFPRPGLNDPWNREIPDLCTPDRFRG